MSTYLNKIEYGITIDVPMQSAADPARFKCSDHPTTNLYTNFFGIHYPYFLITNTAVAKIVFQHKGTLYGLSPPQGRPDPLIGWPGSMGIWAPTLSPKCVLSNACRPISHVIPEPSKQL